MLGPDVFCWQLICNLYHILGAFVYHVKPKTFKDVELVINTFKSHKTSIDRYRYVHIYCDINELLGSYSCDLITRFSVSFEESRCIKSIFCNIFTLNQISKVFGKTPCCVLNDVSWLPMITTSVKIASSLKWDVGASQINCIPCIQSGFYHTMNVPIAMNTQG